MVSRTIRVVRVCRVIRVIRAWALYRPPYGPFIDPLWTLYGPPMACLHVLLLLLLLLSTLFEPPMGPCGTPRNFTTLADLHASH
jgi:hypothetical protein